MRNVSQHLDDYATDHPTRRRQTKPGTTEPIGRRLLEVGTWDQNHVNWLGGTLDLRRARAAAELLYAAIHATAVTAPAPGEYDTVRIPTLHQLVLLQL
jgi:hypothetical protein